MGMRVGRSRKLSTKELILLNCGAGEDSSESLDYKEIKPGNPEWNQTVIFIGKIDTETEAPILLSDAKRRLIRKDWCWERLEAGGKEMTEDETVGWHHWLNGHEFEQGPGDRKGQGSLRCCSPWGHKESDTPEQLNNNNTNLLKYYLY